MNVIKTISAWSFLIQHFLSNFTIPGGKVFAQLLNGWILCTVRRTVTGILPFADPQGRHAHDAFHRFFPDARWKMTGLWRMLAQILIKTFYRTGTITLAVDDTLFHHSGKKMDGAGWWPDAVHSTSTKSISAWGLNLMVLTLQIQPPCGGDPLGLPINMRLHRKKQASPIELAEQMIKKLVEWHPKSRLRSAADGLVRVVADGFYATVAGKNLCNTTIISRIKRNAEIYDLPVKPKKKHRGRPRKKGKRLLCPQKLAKSVRHWQKVQVCERGKSRIRLVHPKVLLWYLKHKSSQQYFMVYPWNPMKCRPSFADAIGCLRRELWRERIKCMFGKSAGHDKKLEFLLEALAPAA